VEYAVEHLEVRDIIICGHSDCGAMKALYRERGTFAATPHIGQWLRHGDRTMAVVAANYPELSREERYEITAEENVLLQMENLRTYPVVQKAAAKGRLHVHACLGCRLTEGAQVVGALTADALQPVYGGGPNDAFVTVFGAAGELVYSTFLGGSGDDQGKGNGDGDNNARKDQFALKVTQVSGGAAQVEYTLPEEAEMTLSVYNVAGRRVATIAQGRQPAGTGSVQWTAPNPVPTVYFVQLRSGDKSVAKRIFFINR